MKSFLKRKFEFSADCRIWISRQNRNLNIARKIEFPAENFEISTKVFEFTAEIDIWISHQKWNLNLPPKFEFPDTARIWISRQN